MDKPARRSAEGILSHVDLDPIVAYLPTRLWNNLSRLMRVFEESAMQRVRRAEQRVQQYAEAEYDRLRHLQADVSVSRMDEYATASSVVHVEWRPERLGIRYLDPPYLRGLSRIEQADHQRRVAELLARDLAEAIYKSFRSCR
ncbi:MAG: hypothetical protein ACOVT5_04185 [Armatimonadaceae bacterium]